MSSPSESSPHDLPTITVVVLAYGDEPWLSDCLTAVAASEGVAVNLVVVDNGCTRADVDELAAGAGGSVRRPEQNLGFAGGCNLGAADAASELVAFVNSDAIVEPRCLARLAVELDDPSVGLASALLLLGDQPGVVNSAGNPVHVSCMSWAGEYGRPAGEVASRDVASITGGVFAARRADWETWGGFWGELFAYLEDTELSIRCWQQGKRVRSVADARALHHYEFSRNELKTYLLERNRLLLVLTTWQVSSLLRLAPVLWMMELLLFALAVRQRWAGAKVRGWWWVARNVGTVRARRRSVQAQRTVKDRSLRYLFQTRIAPTNVSAPPLMGAFNALMAGWCRLAFRAKSVRPEAAP